MSLLMNALKKAESAKQGTAAGSAADSPATLTSESRDLREELGLDPPAPRAAIPVAEASAPLSRPGPLLKPMELALETDTPAPAAPASAPVTANTPGAATGRMRPAPGASTVGRGAEAAGARAVFAAKQPKPRNPQMPFYTVVGACVLTALGYGGYLWWQMQPPRPVAAASGAATRPQPTAPAPKPVPPVIIAQGTASTSTESTASGALAGHSNSSASTSASSTPTAASQPLARQTQGGADRTPLGDARQREPVPPEAQATRNARRDPAPVRDAARAEGGAPVESPSNLRITRNASPVAVNPDVLAGYAALQAGDLDRAGQSYDRALRTDPGNRDALLGAATVLLRLDRADAAEAYFRQTLRLHPNDPYATAQLAALTARGDPVGALSQVNSVIAREAERSEGGGSGGALAFVQGNQLAAQSRWPEAQQAYFNAHRADPGNADYCYNLAVSLDRVHEPRLARDFYAKAIELARIRPAGFDATRARVRLAQLEAALK